ncbi:restriction endonuclease subunit S [Corynebacterium sp. NML130628]|uniref:restriction endonuclease subunit S n=1 Tax=Corynebacterium sp. NML130628 TaxID=1906333 RepID=UPI0008FB0DD8|nr:restriction endonuclease subunit S [Corynebacterium sp. NML130628]OIR43641.1 hypothetical protein BJP07_06570 [Corynebacterium sp. NML130628]
MGWEMVKLGDVCEIVVGKTPARKQQKYWGGSHPWLSISDMSGQGKLISHTKEQITDAAVEEVKPPLLPAGTVVMSFKLTIGSVGILQRPMHTNEAIAGLIPYNPALIDNDFLASAASTSAIRAKTNSAVMGKTLNKKMLSQLQIPLPSLEEQQRIAKILDTVEEARTQQHALISELNSLEIAVCDGIFSAATEKIRLEEIADLQGGLTLNKRRKDNPIEVNYLRVGNVQRRSLELSVVKTIRCKENEVHRCELRKGDVLLVEANANPYEVGRAAQVPEFDTPTVYQNHLFRARPKNDVHPDYLEQAINSMSVRRQLVALARTTSGLNGFSISQARRLQVPWLSQRMQTELADRVSGIRQARVLQEEKAHRINELYACLSSRAFAGEL